MMAKVKAMLSRKSKEYNTSSSSHKEQTELDPLQDLFSLNLTTSHDKETTTWKEVSAGEAKKKKVALKCLTDRTSYK